MKRSPVRLAFWVLLLFNVLNYADRYILPAALPKIQAELQLTPVQEGLLGSAFVLVYAVSTLPLGIVADRWMRKTIVGLSVALWSLATVAGSLAQSFSQLLATRAGVGFGQGGYAPASFSLLGDYFPKLQRGRVLAYWTAGSLLGAAIGFTAGGMLADAFGWRVVFYGAGVIGLGLALLTFLMREPVRGAYETLAASATKESANTEGSLRQTATTLAHIPTYWTIVVAYVFSLFAVGGITYWLPTYCVKTFGLSVADAGLLSGLVLVTSGIVGTLLGGWAADLAVVRWPAGRLATVALGFLVGTPFALAALLTTNLVPFVALIVVGALFLNLCNAPLNAAIQDVVAPNMRATAVGIILLVGHVLGDALAPFAIGALDNSLHSLLAALLITIPTTLAIAGLVCLVGLKVVASDMRAA